MSWQKCPLCNGDGELPSSTCKSGYGCSYWYFENNAWMQFDVTPISSSNYSSGRKVCHVCAGKGIINSYTGKPPKDDLPNNNFDGPIKF